ncbi:MAG: hypothetical protein M3R38_29220 [Actinomycetota bacterium]|nr:hypothetical protein [Actinomycetota bacterium]MDP9486921.1 hypothetical protein [Actinomycetota bacterium]
MKAVNETSTGAALISVALLLLYAGSAGTPAFAQYDVSPGDQYGLAPGQYGQYDLADGQYGQYGLPESQYDLAPGDQYGLPPEDQYDFDDGQYNLPPEDQYDLPPTTTAPLPESQYGAPAEDRNVGGGDTGNADTAPVDKGNDAGGDTGGGDTGGGDTAPVGDGNAAGGNTGATAPVGEGPNEDDDDATEPAATPERRTVGANGRGIGSLGGVLVGGIVLLAVLSLIAALAFLIERRGDRRGR